MQICNEPQNRMYLFQTSFLIKYKTEIHKLEEEKKNEVPVSSENEGTEIHCISFTLSFLHWVS